MMRTEQGGRCFALSLPQRDLWIAHQLDPRSYNDAVMYEVTGTFDVAAWRGALGELVERHDTLRTSFARVADDLAQIVSSRVDIPFEVVDATGWDRARVEAA